MRREDRSGVAPLLEGEFARSDRKGGHIWLSSANTNLDFVRKRASAAAAIADPTVSNGRRSYLTLRGQTTLFLHILGQPKICDFRLACAFE